MDPYYKSKEFLDILAQYEAMRDQGVGGFLDASDYADVAEYYLMQNDKQHAKQAATEGVSIFPDALPPLAVLARIELNNGHFDEANDIIERAEDKTELEYHYVKAELLVAMGDSLGADRYLSNIETEEDPDDVALDACAIFIDHNDFNWARKWLDKVKDRTKQDVQDFEAHILTGLGEFEEGEKKVNELLDEDPYSTEHWNHLAGVQYMRGDYNASIESSDFTLAIDANNAEALLNKANAFYSLKNYEKAITFYERFLELMPDNETGLYYYGVSLAITRQLEKSVVVLKKALSVILAGVKEGDSRCKDLLIDALHELTYDLSELKQYDEAHKCLDHAISVIISEEDLRLQCSDLYLCKAKLCFLQGDGDGAIDAFESARQVYDEPETFVRMTAVLYECGYPDRAYDILGAQLFSEEGRTWRTGHAYLARYAYELGQLEVFKMLVPIALERNPIEMSNLLSDLFPPGTQLKDYPNTDPIPLDELPGE